MNVIGMAGGTAEERRAWIEAAAPRLSAFPGLSVGRRDLGDACVAWAVSEHAPFSECSEPDGSACLCFGTVYEAPPGREAPYILGRQGKEGTEKIAGLNGLYCAIGRAPGGVFSVGADFLGVLPVYHYSTADRFFFSTTPEAFRHVPGFSPELDPEGLAALLMTDVLPTGATLLKKVRRALGAHAVVWRRGAEAAERRGHAIRAGDAHFGKPFRRQVDLVRSILEAAVQRERRRTSAPAMLLTGGLDSRLLCGFLERSFGRGVNALTQGWRDDLEMRCSRLLARRLGWRHRAYEPDFSCFESYALLKLRNEHLANGFNTPCFMQLVPHLRAAGPVHFSGVHGTASIGAVSLRNIERLDPGFSFEACNRSLQDRAFGEAEVRKLVPPSVLGDGVERAVGRLREIYGSFEGSPYQRAWLYDLLAVDRVRVGFIPRMLTFGSWPCAPFTDRDLLETIANLPYETIRGRRLETEIVCSSFPHLAALPLDRNDFDTSPVLGLKRFLSRPQDYLAHAPAVLRSHLQAKLGAPLECLGARLAGRERRFYYRSFDLNNAGWRQVRRTAERCRASLDAFLEPSAVEACLPAADSAVSLKGGMTEANRVKILLGLSLWSSENLDLARAA